MWDLEKYCVPHYWGNVVHYLKLESVKFEPDLTSMIVLAIDAIYGVETNNLWIQVKSLSKRNCHLQLLSYFFGFEIILATT